MKNFFLVLVISLIGFQSISQETLIVSTKLDSLIWEKINDYRASIGEKPCYSFESANMRKYSQRITERNSIVKVGYHSDSVGIACNGECLFQLSTSGDSPGVKKKVDDALSENFEYLAEQAVQSWINSSSHEAIISYPTWNVSTVTSRVVISQDKQSLRLDCSYHCKTAETYDTKKGKK
jgi:hypothetical protein